MLNSSDVPTVTVIAFAVKNERIQTLWALRNPDKLRAWP
jgi:hypothetical protein